MSNSFTGLCLLLLSGIFISPLQVLASMTCVDSFLHENSSTKINVSSIEEKINSADLVDVNVWANALKEKVSSYEKSHFSANSVSVAIAPMGGSKIRAFSEMNIDGLVIVDWTSPGSANEVLEAFKEKKNLSKAVEEGIALGGMDTSTVKNSPPIAQILAKLKIELGVKSVNVKFFEKNMFTGDSQIVQLNFHWNGRPRSILFIQHTVAADSAKNPGLPTELLRSIRPEGYRWTYLSADGRGFFSSFPGGNGLLTASRQLLSMSEPGGGVLLDYSTANSIQNFEGMTFMASRADLETFGLKRQATLVNNYNKPVFGYLKKGEEVRLYVNKNRRSGPDLKSETIFNLIGFEKRSDLNLIID